MALQPRRIRQLPPALPAQDSDVFPVSQMDPDTGVATTRAMSRSQFQADLIDVIGRARQQFVDMANAQHGEMHDEIDALEARINTVANTAPAWTALTGKPATFPPSSHQHAIADVNGLQAALDSAAASPVQPTWATLSGKPSSFTPATHQHAISDVSGLQAALDSAAASPAQPTWSTLAGKPSTFPPSTHTHAISEVAGLQAALDAKEPLNQRAILTYSGADITWTYPVAFAAGVVPVVEALAEGPATGTNAANLFNVQLVGAPTNTSCKFRVNMVSGASINLLGLASLNLFSQAPTGVRIHATARTP